MLWPSVLFLGLHRMRIAVTLEYNDAAFQNERQHHWRTSIQGSIAGSEEEEEEVVAETFSLCGNT